MKNKSIQGLRGLFAIGVLLSHCYFLGEYEQSATVFNMILKKMANVSFFFILSGFFLVNSQSIHLPIIQFLKKKLLRIYPLHLLVLLALVVLAVVNGNFLFNYTLPLNALLLQTWIPNLECATSYNTVSWYLSSLLFCYIAGYWLLRACKNHKHIIYAIVTFLVIYKVVVAIMFPTGNIGYYLCYLCPIAGFADFMIGVTVALLLREQKISKSIGLQIFSIIVCIISFALKSLLPTNFCRAFLMLPANVVLLISFSVETKFSDFLFGNKAMCFLGDISFEIYMMHTLIIGVVGSKQLLGRLSPIISPFLTLLILICCCVTAAVIYKTAFLFVTKHYKKQPSI